MFLLYFVVPISDRKLTQTETVGRPADTRFYKSLPASEDMQGTIERYEADLDKHKIDINTMCDTPSSNKHILIFCYTV